MNTASQLQGATALASDGEAGTVKDIYFDDEHWTVRYLVVKTGGWFDSRDVLVSPMAVTGTDAANGRVNLNISKEQIRKAPDIDTDKPVSRQHESLFADYYGYPYYWAGPLSWGYAAYPVVPLGRPAQDLSRAAAGQAGREQQQPGDPHLRSSKEVAGYEIRATDDSVGHAEDFLIDEKDWAIKLIVVDTRNWWPGRKVLISPDRIDRVSWDDKQIAVNNTRAEIQRSPDYDRAKLEPQPDRASATERI